MTTGQVIDIITEAGLDYHDFKCGHAAQLATDLGTTNAWEAIAEFPSRYNGEAIEKAWELAGMQDPYRD